MAKFILEVQEVVRLYFLPITNPRAAWNELRSCGIPIGENTK